MAQSTDVSAFKSAHHFSDNKQMRKTAPCPALQMRR